MTSPFQGDDPLAPLFLPAAQGPAVPLRYRSGRVVSWDVATCQNIIEIDGVQFTNLPLHPGTYTDLVAVGNTVSLLSTTDERGISTYVVIGLIIPPPDDRLLKPVDTMGKIVARGRRLSDSTGTTGETGVLRLDDVPVVAGRIYAINTGILHMISTVNTDQIEACVRHTTDGSTPTTSSALLPGGRAQGKAPAGASLFGDSKGQLSLLYAPETSHDLSLLLCVRRDAGTGTVRLIGTSNFAIELWIEDHGIDPGDTGVDI